MNDTPTISTNAGRCIYLGLHDDPETPFAYPSAWNYCFRVKHPGSVDLQHQGKVCLDLAHTDCPIYRAGNPHSLPANLKGRIKNHGPSFMTNRGVLFALLILLVVSLAVVLVLSGIGK